MDYGPSAGPLTHRVGASDGNVYRLGSYTSPFLFNVTISGLDANTAYYYRVAGASATFRFATAPPVGWAGSLVFALVGDLGQTEDSAATVQHVLADKGLTAVVHAGDLSYADGDQPRWDSWGRLVQPVAAQTAWMVVEGNHEIEDSYGTRFLAYQSRFRMPFRASGAGEGNLYYSFSVGSVHWVMLGSYTDYDAQSPQYAWLKQDLARVDRGQTPWLFVVLHAPWYNSNQAHQGEGEAMRQAMEPLLQAYGVDAVFCGHVHAYERTRRVKGGSVDPTGFVEINVGDGGNREGPASTWLSPQPAWSAFREASFGHGLLDVVNATHAHWTWHRNQDGEPVVSDDAWITRP